MTTKSPPRKTQTTDTDDNQITLAIQEIRRFRRQIRRQEFERAVESMDLNSRQAFAISLLSYRLVRRLTETQIQELEHSDDQELGKAALSLYDFNRDRNE